MPSRARLLRHIATAIQALPNTFITRVAVDGIDGAGKTVFADELAHTLEEIGSRVIRASVDFFHNPRDIRYRLGKTSPRGFFQDSYNYDLLKARLLDPLGPGGSGRYRSVAFDHRIDSSVDGPEEQAEPGSILVFDGIFLHRPELRACWDFSIFLHVDFPISIARCSQRDHGSPDPESETNRRYVEGQRIYLSECDPKRHATMVVNNENLDTPYILSIKTSRGSDSPI